MIFCVFSYNRGNFLEHCVASVERCIPAAAICVLDDGSDDPATREALARLSARHTVVGTDADSGGGKHGGLYTNMQRALERFPEASLLCFLQDDMQVVRTLNSGEIASFARHFERFPRAAFLQPCFLKGCARDQDAASLGFDPAREVYLRAAGRRSVGVHYSDILITQPARLLEKGWRFGASEPANERQAAALFEPMGHLFAPFAMWLPEVPAWRGKRKTLALRLAEKRRGCGFHPFETMSAAQAEALRRRDPARLAVAEDFLCCTSPLPRPWSYYPLQGSRLLKKLNSAEVFLRRLVDKK